MTYINNAKPAYLISFISQLLVAILILLSSPTYADDSVDGFDHFTTGFPLTGRHEIVDCSSCHLYGQFKGTPLECHLCHNESRAPGKNPGHFPSSKFCDNCHTDYTWRGARYDHSDIQQTCTNCHNNSIAVGKSPSHILSTQDCEDCHSTVVFAPIGRVNHDAVIGLCNSCHNGVIAGGKDANHVPTTADCDACHLNTITFKGAIFDHATAIGACFSCHNGVIATGQNPGHLLTAKDCGACHTTQGFLPADTTVPP